MSAHSPDERLSAFYDGELSAVERAEVERLVNAQPALRAELSTLSGLSQQLSDLANDVPNVDLRPRVMQRIAASRPVISSSDGPSRRRWMPLMLMVSSLALLVAAVWPLMSHLSPPDLIVDHGPRAMTVDDLAIAMKDASVASASSAKFQGESVASHDSPMMASMAATDGAGFGGAMEAIADSSDSLDGTGPSELLARIERQRDLKPGDIVSQMVEGGDVPMIAEYTVIDVRRSARDVELLLRKHSIVPLLASDRRENSASMGGREQQDMPPLSEILKVYLVDAESASLNTAMIECQNLREVVALNVEPLGLFDVGEAPLASVNGPTTQPVAAADSTPIAPISPSAAMRSAVVAPGSPAAVGEAMSKGGPVARKSMAVDSQPLTGAKNSVDKKVVDVAREKEKAASVVNGNSFVIENGDEFYSEVMQRQVQSLQNADRAYAPKQQQNMEVPEITGRNAPAAQALEALSTPNQFLRIDGRMGGNGLTYNNSYYGGRSRQRAILVLRSQSPPPPPEATRLNP